LQKFPQDEDFFKFTPLITFKNKNFCIIEDDANSLNRQNYTKLTSRNSSKQFTQNTQNSQFTVISSEIDFDQGGVSLKPIQKQNNS
jgi:hypothetical protein